VKGRCATTRPSKMVLNMESNAVKAIPMKNKLFILTIDISLLVALSCSSSFSSFFFFFTSDKSAVSFFFSIFLHCLSTSAFNRLNVSVLYTISQVNPSPNKAVHIETTITNEQSIHMMTKGCNTILITSLGFYI